MNQGHKIRQDIEMFFFILNLTGPLQYKRETDPYGKAMKKYSK